MAALRFPPGRAGRVWLSERLAVATSALSLLENKRALLEGEQRRLRAHLDRTARDWERACSAALEWQMRAALFGGTRSVLEAAPVAHADVQVRRTTLAGVDYPESIESAASQADSAQIISSAGLYHACEAHRRALAAAAEHAAAAAAVRAVERELAVTRIHARAVRHRRIPGLRAALAELDLTLEERERDERVTARAAEAGRSPGS
jgi:V/A-type H+-transporting ATPase subunit D